ncbi:hypothetical protein ACFQ5J_04430 [Lacticaseibacillus baoqingensis]|uniref:Lipoprotein n=1 Tax=Lacticaseibacillus baoqingensis TaxID=2486013 RepID=A0ABW4E680_9LACO|nr:hypothetical protein [Lacticaseibacillus baoqingensis]
MHKKVLIPIILTTALALTACGTSAKADTAKLQSQNSSLKQEVKSLKGQVQTQNSTKTTATTSPNKKTTTQATAVMGKEYVIKDKSGKKLVGLTLTQANNSFGSYVTEDDLLDDPDFNLGKKANLVQIAMTYTNYGLDEEWDPSTDLTIYDDTGAKAEDTDYEDGGDGVSQGHSGTLTTWVALTKPYSNNHKLEIEYDGYIGVDDDHEDEYKAKWVTEY